MINEINQKIKFIECTDGNIVFAEDIVKFRKTNDNDTTEIYTISDSEKHECSFALGVLLDKIFGGGNYEIIKPDEPLSTDDLAAIVG